MSRLYDTVEPAVIDDEMLKKAVEEQGPKDEAERIAKQEGIDFKDVLYLRLDFKSEWWILCNYVPQQLVSKIVYFNRYPKNWQPVAVQEAH